MAMHTSDTRTGLRLFAGAGLVGGFMVFGVPAALTSTWSAIEESTSSRMGSEGVTLLLVWLGLGAAALLVAAIGLFLAIRRRARGTSTRPSTPVSPTGVSRAHAHGRAEPAMG